MNQRRSNPDKSNMRYAFVTENGLTLCEPNFTIQSPIPVQGSALRLKTLRLGLRAIRSFTRESPVSFLPFPKITRLLVRLDHIARVIENTNHSIM